MNVDPDKIADTVISTFRSLPAKCKPRTRDEKSREWIPLSGIVARDENGFKCLSVASGMKCLPQAKVPEAQGIVLHDWHAEVLAIRSFNRYLLEECFALAKSGKTSSDLLRRRRPDELTESNFQMFALHDGIDLHMYCSEAPCGDASMELTMAAQEDSSPWELPPTKPSSEETFIDVNSLNDPEKLLGRGYFSELGIVRRKPSRPDAPPTLSKSCSDKIALKQSTSLLNSVLSLFISPSNLYISSLVLPQSQTSDIACERSFSKNGRLASLVGKTWEGGYRFQPFHVHSTSQEFEFSRRSAQPGQKLVPSNISAAWTPNMAESQIGGILQGRKQGDPRGASRVCKRRVWKLAIDVAAVLAVPALRLALEQTSYRKVKDSSLLATRRQVKKDVRAGPLKGWVRNVAEGEEFGSKDVVA